MELSDFKISYIFSKESFSYISGNGTLHFLSPGSKSKKSTLRKFLILWKTSYIFLKESFSYISGNGTFLYFRKGILRTMA